MNWQLTNVLKILVKMVEVVCQLLVVLSVPVKLVIQDNYVNK